MITTRAVPAPLPAHHRRVAPEAAIKNDFADPLLTPAGHPPCFACGTGVPPCPPGILAQPGYLANVPSALPGAASGSAAGAAVRGAWAIWVPGEGASR
jgi:hypothetical protein